MNNTTLKTVDRMHFDKEIIILLLSDVNNSLRPRIKPLYVIMYVARALISRPIRNNKLN